MTSTENHGRAEARRMRPRRKPTVREVVEPGRRAGATDATVDSTGPSSPSTPRRQTHRRAPQPPEVPSDAEIYWRMRHRR
jgi:hypothetical protein